MLQSTQPHKNLRKIPPTIFKNNEMVLLHITCTQKSLSYHLSRSHSGAALVICHCTDKKGEHSDTPGHFCISLTSNFSNRRKLPSVPLELSAPSFPSPLRRASLIRS